MPKKSARPRLRTHIRRGANGQVWTSWSYDGRPDGVPDVSLGNDYEAALVKWAELFHHKPRIKGTLMEAFEAWEKEALPVYTNTETRKSYARQLGRLKPIFGPATWDQVGMPDLKGYLKKRTAKTQGNRELAVLSIVWNYARGEGFTKLPWPAAGLERSKWKNKEQARQLEVTDALFAAVYGTACPALQQCMDLASATGMRLTDCRTILLPPSGTSLTVRASKTGKSATFDLTLSPILTELVNSRRMMRCSHLMLLSTPSGRPVSARMLRDWWDEAREKAAIANPEIADELRAMYLRDMRKRAADLAGSLDEASELLQHSNKQTTRIHYRTRPTKLRPVR
jgi:integrase